MAKTAGGVRNYRTYSSAYNKRRDEFYGLMATGQYKPDASRFYKGGGFVAVHKEHNVARRDESGRLVDKSDEAARKLARKGFRVYLESEKSNKMKVSTPDGRIERLAMDIKTINKTGKYTIKATLEHASKQGASSVVLMQGTRSMTRQYVESQIEMFRQKSPKKAREKIKNVITVGISGNVHRHKV